MWQSEAGPRGFSEASRWAFRSGVLSPGPAPALGVTGRPTGPGTERPCRLVPRRAGLRPGAERHRTSRSGVETKAFQPAATGQLLFLGEEESDTAREDQRPGDCGKHLVLWRFVKPVARPVQNLGGDRPAYQGHIGVQPGKIHHPASANLATLYGRAFEVPELRKKPKRGNVFVREAWLPVAICAFS